MEQVQPTKRCGRCKQLKARDDFNKNRRCPSGLASYCRTCSREQGTRYYHEKATPEQLRRAYTAANKKRSLARLAAKQLRLTSPLKTCGRCKLAKPRDDFGKDRGRPDGLAGYCKECARAQRKQQYLKHPETNIAAATAYKQKHATRYRARAKDRYHQDVEKSRATARRDHQKPAYRQYASTYLAKRRAKLRGVTVEDVDRRKVYTRDNGVCHICQLPVSYADFHVDHVVPIVKGGEHSYANCKTSHSTCNARKRDKLMEEL